MTEINQNSLASHQSVDEVSRHPGDKNQGNGTHGRQPLNDSTRGLNHESASGSVNISFNAHMRLRAYQDQKEHLPEQSLMADSNLSMEVVPEGLHNQSLKSDLTHMELSEQNRVRNNQETEATSLSKNSELNHFSEKMSSMLTEVENNIVQASEPGYRYLVDMLNNYQTTVGDTQQLQEVMRKEEFYLSRRKPFMDSADFQSYSQVLNQFSNIIARQQYI